MQDGRERKILRRGRIKSVTPKIEIGERTKERMKERAVRRREGAKAGNKCICNACGSSGALRGIREQKEALIKRVLLPPRFSRGRSTIPLFDPYTQRSHGKQGLKPERPN